MKLRVTAAIAFAVCVAVAIGIYAYSQYRGEEETAAGEIRTFDSYGQIQRALSKIKDEDMPVYMMNNSPGIVEDAEMATNEVMGNAATGAVPKGSERSETYVQVEGVDEADIVKTDGNYIYYTSRLGYDVIIAKVSDGKAEDAAVISEEESGVSAENLFLTEDRLILTGQEYEMQPEDDQYNYYSKPMVTAVCIYDISDPEKPQLIGKYRQSGGYVSSRVTDGYLYVVTNDYLNRGENRYVPYAGADKKYEKLAADHICCFPQPYRKAYAVIGSVDVNSSKGKIKSKTRAVLGASDDIYCSGSAIYVTDYTVDYRDISPESADERTYIIKADISKGKIAFAKQGSVRGSVLNQFAMDEKDGYFRVAATAFVKGKDVNYLYVLDENLNVAGKVKGFAAGEQIKAVRFLGDMAYVITYEQTDPLFVIDLKDPEAPEMLGSVKITGFSSLLVPEGDDMIIGIGTATSEEEFGEVENGIKIALFDVSDPMKPEVLDSMTYKDLTSDVQNDHRALTANSKAGWYAVPYLNWEKESGGVLQFAVSGKKLEEIGNYENKEGISRCLYIDDHIYGLEDNNDTIVSWMIKGNEGK